MAATGSPARRGRGSAIGGGAGRQRGRASRRTASEAGGPSAPARIGPTRSAVRRAGPNGPEPATRSRYRALARPSSTSALRSWGPGFLSTPSSSRPQSLLPVLRKSRHQPGPLAGRMTELQSALLLRRQLAELNKNPVEGFSAGLIDDNDLYRWEVLIIGPPDTLYEGGVFKAHLTFPKDYPLRPPKMKFITEIWHPNVDKNGDVCISILHEPGEDKYGYEKPEERWLPIHTVETIMISVISMLADPNGDSPANVDAAKEWREDRNGDFKRKVARCVRKSQETAFE
ncbi:ubiquitin-conjugating enzyme E2 G1 [Choloepus didactylus]|uniref:ubiquitin-conjugating enzyme E2 G1 n=2 Tax=Choloepus didactylus TaxID=27675 RepID=UPI00189D1DE9|nr:ubiquitin-conjugating enzyme E2 G1 [Choloepus didactylus]